MWQPNGRIRVLCITVGMATFGVACARPSHEDLNVMTMPAVCDSAPPHRSGPTPVIPTLSAAATGFGAIVGAVSESGTGLALPHATIDIARLDGPPDPRLFAADSLGGFVLDTLSVGTYRLRVRWFDHRFHLRELRVTAGSVDTVLVALSYYRCVGS